MSKQCGNGFNRESQIRFALDVLCAHPYEQSDVSTFKYEDFLKWIGSNRVWIFC